MKFLIDEDIPVKLLKFLSGLGHDALCVCPSSSDPEIADRSKKEGRILITLDKDFTNTSMYPPADFNIVRIHIHPPYTDAIIEAFQKLIGTLRPEEFKGLIVLQKGGHIRIPS